MIPLSVPHIKGNEWKYVKECLDTEWVSTAGKYVGQFEDSLREYTDAGHAVACVNGTAALQVALRIVGVLPGDEVIVPTVTFVATVNAVSYQGGAPIFMDCDDYYNIDSAKVLEFLEKQTETRDGSTYNRISGRRIAAIVPVHVFGNAARLEDLLDTCHERNIKVVEDAAESLGTAYTEGRLAGRHTGTVGDFGCFSFNGNKIITTGGGGMIVTDNPEYAERARYLTTQAKDDEVRYIHEDIGYNYRLTNVQAAIGVAQMECLPEFLEAKRRSFESYDSALEDVEGLQLAASPAYARNNHWMYPLRIDRQAYGRDREALMRDLQSKGVQTRPLWQLNHLQTPFRDFQHYRIERAPRLLEETLNLPCSVNLTQSDVDYVVQALVDE